MFNKLTILLLAVAAFSVNPLNAQIFVENDDNQQAEETPETIISAGCEEIFDPPPPVEA